MDSFTQSKFKSWKRSRKLQNLDHHSKKVSQIKITNWKNVKLKINTKFLNQTKLYLVMDQKTIKCIRAI